jgi:hypothetical protein
VDVEPCVPHCVGEGERADESEAGGVDEQGEMDERFGGAEAEGVGAVEERDGFGVAVGNVSNMACRRLGGGMLTFADMSEEGVVVSQILYLGFQDERIRTSDRSTHILCCRSNYSMIR